MDVGWEDIVTGLAKIHMIVRMDRSIPSFSAPHDFIGPIGDDLIGIHVGGGARTGLEDIHQKLVTKLPFDDFPGGQADGFREVVLDQSQLPVD